MDLPVFALHTVPFPGLPIGLRVFEERYLRMLEDLGPEGTFVIAAIRHGQEVAGPAELHSVGVSVSAGVRDELPDGTIELEVVGDERVALETLVDHDPYPVWRVRSFPDEGGAGTDDVEAAVEALSSYLTAIGEVDLRPVLPHDPVTASWALAAASPGTPAVRQRLLEIPGAGDRLRAERELFRREALVVRTLGAGVAAPDLGVNPN